MTVVRLDSRSRPSCHGCGKGIDDQFLLSALDAFWHDRCLQCDCCSVPLAEIGRSFYYKFGRKFCRDDYRRLFGPTGCCCSCKKPIFSHDMVIKLETNDIFHLLCFVCIVCKRSFCVGEQFYFADSEKKIICPKDMLLQASDSTQPVDESYIEE